MTRVQINEVAPRDGLQMEQALVPTDRKVAFVDALSACGSARIEVTSFVSPKAVPALADAEAVMQRIVRDPRVVYAVLVPNVRGMVRALEAQADELNLVMSCSESHNQANLRMSCESSKRQLTDIITDAAQARVPCRVSLSTAFGCPFEGEVDAAQVCRLAGAFFEAGAEGVTLCDTTGMADPRRTAELLRAVNRVLPTDRITVHLHDTRGMALANALAALDHGVRSFDAACAGLGGCPFAPGASGNVSTEELVHMFERMGVETGVSLERLMAVSAAVPQLVQRPFVSRLQAAGPATRLHPRPAAIDAQGARATAH